MYIYFTLFFINLMKHIAFLLVIIIVSNRLSTKIIIKLGVIYRNIHVLIW